MNKNEIIYHLTHEMSLHEIAEAVRQGREVLKYDAVNNSLFVILSENDLQKMGLENNWFRAGSRTGYHRESLPRVADDADCIGLELETERGDSVYSVNLVSNLFGVSSDGSLYCGGMECIFRAIPVSVSGLYHFVANILPKVASLLSSNGWTSWRGGHCGLHLHRSIAAHPEDWRRVFAANLDAVGNGEEMGRIFRASMYDGSWGQLRQKLSDALRASSDFALALAMCQDAPNTAPVQEIRAKLRKETEKRTMDSMGNRSFIGVGNSGKTIEYRLGRGSLRIERLQMEVAALFRMSEGLPPIPPPEERGRLAELTRRNHAAIFGGEEG